MLHQNALRLSSMWHSDFTVPTQYMRFLSFGTGNQPPRFVLPENELLLQVKEGNAIGDLIYTLVGSDPEGQELHFDVRGQIGGELLDIQKINRTAANVYLKKELDRETQDEYQLILTLSDGSRENVIEQSLQILVQDINDNQPVFSPYNSTIYIKEGWLPGIIATLEATDLDEGSYGQVLYRLKETGDHVENFKIETVQGKGVLSLERPLDYEEKYLYQLQIQAIDRPSTGRRNTGTAAVIVEVIDVEDQPPEFVKIPTVIKISEDAPIGWPVLQVAAVDGDRGVNNPIHYSIIHGEGSNHFGIENKTGRVYVRHALDREMSHLNGAHIIKIRATEVGSEIIPAASVETEVTVMIMDINDETPRFRNRSYVGEISENAQLNVPVTFSSDNLPEVYDHDQGANGTFTLSLEGDGGIFEITPSLVINEASFLIRVKNHSLLDYERVKSLQFKILAHETVPSNPKSSTADVVINLKDANDNIPEFGHVEYVAYIREDVVPGTQVIKISAHDRDSGNFGSAGIRYTELRGHIADKLILNPITGAILVKSGGEAFDREQVPTYYVTVVARDDLGLGNRNTVQIQLIIEDVNDNTPEFLRKSYEIRVEENEAAFSHPFYVEAYDKDLEGNPNSEIRFEIVDGDPMRNFTINSTTGEITLKSFLDFEAMNKTEDFRYFNLTVLAKDMGEPVLSSNVTVTVYVQDQNDHYPKFTELMYSAAVREDIRPGDPIIQLHAYDNDGSYPNNQVVYRLLSGGQDKFVIHVQQGVISVAQAANLDPDLTEPKTHYYVLNVAAVDGGLGSDQKQSVIRVNITVNDVNNKVPEFKTIPEISLKENIPFGTVIYKLMAVDRDDNPDLRFQIDPNKCEARNEDGFIVNFSPKDYRSLFEVTADGFVQVKGIVDRETVETFKLRVVVEDRNAVGFRQTSTSIIPIRVEDVNDNDPFFRRSLYRRVIAENSKPGTAIERVVAEDRDANRTITYHLHGTKKIGDLITVDSNTGGIFVKAKIDREQYPWLNFTVKATDNGIPPRTGFTNVSIQVLDENDNNPVFAKETYSFHISEDSPVGSIVGIISATDADTGEYSKITYVLDKRTTMGKFSINPGTGVITVTETLDRENRDRYILVVEAWDNYDVGHLTGESRKSFKQVSVFVTDKNDQTPELVKLDNCVVVTEYHTIGGVVTILKAKDKDDPTTANSYVDFSIVSGNEKGLFGVMGVDFNSARIITHRSLKQQLGNHTLTIQVRDRGNPPRTSTDNLVICVQDFNDHAPRFVKPSQNHTIRIAEDAEIGSVIFQVQAVDDDIGSNDVSGLVTLQKRLDREKQKNYQLRIEARDLGTPTALASDMDIHIYVKNVVDIEPIFEKRQVVIYFTENMEPGNETVMLTETMDLEEYEAEDDAVTICYFIISGNEESVFHLDRVTHFVSVTTALDRETRDSYKFLVKATKECNSPPDLTTVSQDIKDDKSFLQVIIKVRDLNDNGPKFTKDIFTGGMTTETAFGSLIQKIEAIDLDLAANAQINYYISGPIDSSLTEGYNAFSSLPFIVNQTTGDILLNFYPQKKMKGYFNFHVLVNDSNGFNDTAKVTIYLVREDQKLVFTIRLTPSEFRSRVDSFQRNLSNITDAIINIDSYKFHENSDGSVDGTKTDVYMHFVHKPTNSILDVKSVTKLVDQHIRDLNELFQEYNVIEAKPAVASDLNASSEEILIAWLIGSSTCLAVLFVVAISVCVTQRRRYQRQIKAATVLAFGSQESNLSRTTVPNTNQHTTQGSNPIWMHSYENEWYKEGDELSTGTNTSNDNSLDENVINDVDEHSQTSTAQVQDIPPTVELSSSEARSKVNNSCTVSHNGNGNGHCKAKITARDAACCDPLSIKHQNDLNKFQGSLRHHNIYESLGLNGSALSAHIETTEL
ncbi:hypothetical protein CHUAL_012969 [Chamberlinius hualienensis]